MMLLLLPALIFLGGCASTPTEPPANENAEAVTSRAALSPEETDLASAENLVAKGQFEEGILALKRFQKSYPQSKFFQAAKLKEAEGLQGLGKYQEAASLLREVYLVTTGKQPEIAARALYSSSFAYEALGDDLKTLAALLDARKLSAHLPPEIAYAEIPARLASVYARQGREKEAFKFISEADTGIAKALGQSTLESRKTWLGRTYFQMGSVSTNQLSADSFASFTQGQMGVQVYLMKALKLNDPVWSLRAQRKLQETYRDLTTVFSSTSSDIAKQTQLAGDFYDLMDQAELFRPVSGEPANSYEQEFFTYLSEVRRRMDNELYSHKEQMGLTEESRRLNGLRRFLPGEAKSNIPLPPKLVPSEDPNL